VILEVAPGEFLLLAHFRPGSIAVAPGENVTVGQMVGLVGNSGNTSEPHVHLHLQDAPTPDAGEGIPFFFSDYLSVATGEPVERGMPRGGIQRGRFVGDVIESRAPAPAALSSH
jgi:murein DD-endopeptidase MepM/ murein hydrolase activator NlpD